MLVYLWTEINIHPFIFIFNTEPPVDEGSNQPVGGHPRTYADEPQPAGGPAPGARP